MTENHDRDEMQRLLAYANFSKVAEAIGVKRAAVANWAAGRHVTPARLEQVRALYGLDTTKEPPGSSGGLADEVAAKVVATLLGGPEIPVALERLRERLASIPPQPHEVPPEGGEGQDPGTGGRPGRRVG